jgi:hypothetical protein
MLTVRTAILVRTWKVTQLRVQKKGLENEQIRAGRLALGLPRAEQEVEFLSSESGLIMK